MESGSGPAIEGNGQIPSPVADSVEALESSTASGSSGSDEVLKKLLLALEDLDDSVIETVEDLVLAPSTANVSVNQDNLNYLRSSRDMYRRANYSIDSMFDYLERLPTYTRIWTTVTRSLSTGYAQDAARKSFDWKFRIRGIQTAGDKAWRLAVPASHSLANRNYQTVNYLIDYFKIFDDWLDLVKEEEGMERERFSQEFDDTLQAIIHITKQGGPYAPLNTAIINEVKMMIRQARNEEKLLAIKNQQIEPDVPELHAQIAPTKVQAGGKSGTGNWNPILTVIISTFTLLASIFGSVAWACSPHTPGTREDADFWFLLQGCTMSILGLAAIIFPLLDTTTLHLQRQARIATWCVVVFSFGCIAGSIPAYLYFPTEYSATLAFFGGALQSVVILLMMVGKSDM